MANPSTSRLLNYLLAAIAAGMVIWMLLGGKS
jgi:hypothetical protein